MKLFVLLLAALASVQASWFDSSSAITPYDEALDVPGENPLKHCEDPEGDILELESVDLDPNPPQPGKKLTITAVGNLTQPITEGAQIHLLVKYGLITIIKQTADLCDTIKNVDLKCPIDEGKIEIEKEVDLPKVIPPGKYHVVADAVTADDEMVTCLTADVQFKKGKDGDDKSQRVIKEDM